LTDLNVLFMTHRGEGYVGAPSTQHGFEMAVAEQCNCKFAGVGWKDYREGETMLETVNRVMPDADWVMDADNNLHTDKPKGQRFKIGHFVSDIHAKHHYKISSPVGYAQLLNKTHYDAIFMRYKKLQGTQYRPESFWEWLDCEKHWLPWSVEINDYKPKVKNVDVSFIGSTGKCYPIRNSIWSGIYHAARGYRVIREMAPKGKTYDRTNESLKHTHLVGDRYRDALAKSRIFLFGCSIYRYPLQKFFEASASGCLMLCNQPTTARELGLIDGKTFVEVEEGSWERELQYYLENPDACKAIASRGLKNTLLNHRHEKRAEEFINMLKGGI